MAAARELRLNIGTANNWAGRVNPVARKPRNTRSVKTDPPQRYSPAVIEEFLSVLHEIGSGPGVGPDMFVNAEGVHALQSANPSESPRGLSPDSVPDGVPGNPELVGEGRDGGVEPGQRVGGADHGTGGQFRPRSGQFMVLCERGSWTVRARFAHNSRTGRPKHGMSWRRTGRRP